MIILPVHMLSEADLWPIYGQYMLILARSLIYRHICNPPSLYAGNKLSKPGNQEAKLEKALKLVFCFDLGCDLPKTHH